MRKQGILLLVLVLFSMVPAAAQSTAPVINLSVSAGFDGLFRENDWFPLLIRVSNDGDDVTGRLVVRPETSSNAFTNTFSTPIDMPAGSRKTAFLYVTARSFATTVRVEFLDEENLSLASANAPLRSVLAQDQLHVVLTTSSAGSVDLSGISASGYTAFQANWLIENIPDRLAPLQTVDTILFSDIDTGTMTPAQQQVIGDWVAGGGHLIVTGGANWQATAAGLGDVLPLVPEGSDTVSDLSALAEYAHSEGLNDDETIVATGPLTEDARVLAAAGDLPLLVRREAGLGTVDYLAADPLTQPLRDWNDLDRLWFMLASTRTPRPGWVNGFVDYDRATSAVEILPGLNLLPDVLPLCGFLALYVALIGPLNYAILNRINRREYAWVSIPLFIIIFSALAWVVGFNLRGNTATVSRLAVVQSWPDSDDAQVDGLIGLLSPRRTNYTLAVGENSVLRPVAPSVPANPFAANIQASTDIQQSNEFIADNFTVDASFVATFTTSTTMEAPGLGGQVSMFYQPPRFEDEAGHWAIRGSVRNDSSFTLTNPVILARGVSLALVEDLLPGDLETFDLPLIAESLQPAAPSPLERSNPQQISRLTFNRFSRDPSAGEQTIRDIMSDDAYNTRIYVQSPGTTAEEQETYRRQLLLSSIMQDHYLSTGRGNRVFLAGWSDQMPLNTELEGAIWEPMDTTLHIVELAVEVTPPSGRARITADQFTWVAEEREGITADMSPVNTVFQPGDVAVFRYTPLPGAVLADVDTLYIELNTTGGGRLDVPIELWDWNAGEWDTINLQRPDDRSSVRQRSLTNPDRFLGVQNAVQIRVTVDDITSALRVDRLAVEQEGEF